MFLSRGLSGEYGLVPPTEAELLARGREVLRCAGRAARAVRHGPGLRPLARRTLLELVAADAVEQPILLVAALAALGALTAARGTALIGAAAAGRGCCAGLEGRGGVATRGGGACGGWGAAGGGCYEDTTGAR